MSGRRYAGEAAADRLARRRRQLLDAGLELFGTAGYRATTVRQLCRAAKVSDRYFYEQFDSTEDLLLAVYAECTGHLEDAVVAALADVEDTADVHAIAQTGLEGFLRAVEADRRLVRVVWFEVLGVSERVEATYLARMQTFGHLIVGVLGNHSRASSVSVTTRELLANTAVGAVSHTIVTWASSGYATDRAVLTTALARFLAGAAEAVLGGDAAHEVSHT